MTTMLRTAFPGNRIFLINCRERHSTNLLSGDLSEISQNASAILQSCGRNGRTVDKRGGRAQTRAMVFTVFQVALGGAIGASLRFLAGVGVLRLTGPGFPIAILSVNIIGSFLMGVFVVAAAQRGLTHFSPFVMTGILGGFTTFSAFSLEAYTLYERGEMGTALLYVLASVVLSIAGLILGIWLSRGIFA
jgi:CrcB protein